MTGGKQASQQVKCWNANNFFCAFCVIGNICDNQSQRVFSLQMMLSACVMTSSIRPSLLTNIGGRGELTALLDS